MARESNVRIRIDHEIVLLKENDLSNVVLDGRFLFAFDRRRHDRFDDLLRGLHI